MATKTTKKSSLKDELKQVRKNENIKKRQAFLNKVVPLVAKTIVGVLIVVLAYSATYGKMYQLVQDYPKAFAIGLSAVVVTGLMLILAKCDSRK